MSLLGNILNFYAFTHQSKSFLKQFKFDCDILNISSQKWSCNKTLCKLWLFINKPRFLISMIRKEKKRKEKLSNKNGVKKANQEVLSFNLTNFPLKWSKKGKHLGKCEIILMAVYRGSPPYAFFGTWKKSCYMKLVLVGLYCGPLLTLIPPLTRT